MMHHQARAAIFALMRLAFLAALAITLIATALQIVGLCLGWAIRRITKNQNGRQYAVKRNTCRI